jgi:predicted phosphodiesterase
VKVAVLADVHGNAPALRAVLAELRAEAIVVAGDVVGGPQPREVLELLAARPEPVHWIAGNAEREAIRAFDGAPTEDDEAGRAAAWSARALNASWRDELASWPITLAVDGVRYCHGTPRRDDEIITRATPDAALRAALAAVEEPLVVGGHTHQQMVRTGYANAGSVGMPYEGRPGAFWMEVEDGSPRPRETAYDLEAAAAELRATGYPDAEAMLQESQLAPVDADWATDFLERLRG